MSEPIYISGLYRSGTKVLTRLLDQSENIKTTYDTIHFMRFSYNKYLPIEENYEKLVKDTHTRVLGRWDMGFDLKKTLKMIVNQEKITQAVVYDAIMSNFLNLNENMQWAEKTNVEWENSLGFLDMFPNGKVIHIYRDPRAVLASYKHMTNQDGLKYLDAIFASLAMFNFIEQNKVKNNKNIFLLKYEDFVLDPEIQIKKICDFLNIEYKNELLDVNSFTDKFGNKFDTDSSFTEQKKSINGSSINLWKEKLSSIEVYLSEMILKDKLKRFKYELTGTLLSEEEFSELYDILNDNFISKRYKYWLKYADGIQAYPDTPNVYEL